MIAVKKPTIPTISEKITIFCVFSGIQTKSCDHSQSCVKIAINIPVKPISPAKPSKIYEIYENAEIIKISVVNLMLKAKPVSSHAMKKSMSAFL